MLRLLKYLVVLATLLAAVLPVVLVVGALQTEPLVPVGGRATPADVARAKALAKKLDPRGQGAGDLRTVEVPEDDLSFALDYAVGQLWPAGAAVDLHRDGARIALAVRVPENPFGPYLNLRVDLSQVGGGIEVEGLRLGDLRVPSMLARGLGWMIRALLQRDATARALLAGINGYRIAEDRLVVVFQWGPELLDRVKSTGRAALVAEADRERLLAYSARIATATRKTRPGGRMAMTELLAPVFAEARTRTVAPGDAAAENRAALVALMLYVQGVDVARLLDEPADADQRPKARSLRLRGRADLAQHFVISAGIAAAGGGRLADAVGLFKELDDSRVGSGFSFADLAADRAGVRFAEAATGPRAAQVQGMLADGADEALFMPAVKGLPEFTSEAEFERQFGAVGTPRYRQVADEIERRIAALPLHADAK